MEVMLEVLIGVLIMEVKKVADEVTNMEVDEVTNMEVDKVTNMMAEFSLMKLAPPSRKISD